MKIILHFPDLIADQLSKIYDQYDLPPFERYWNIPSKELAEKVQGARILLSMSASREVIEAGSSTLKLIHSFGVGVNRIDLDAAKEFGVQVAHTTANVQATAEHAFALLMACAKHLINSDRTFRDDRWEYSYAGKIYSTELKDKTLLIVGLGRIGRLIAQWANCFGMNVLGIRRTGNQVEGVTVYTPNQLSSLLPLADFVLVSTVAIPPTNDLFSTNEFNLMKSSACFINISRGSVVNPEALFIALSTKTIAGAGVDVWWQYPAETRNLGVERKAPSKFPFKDLANIVMTPHRGGFTKKARAAILHQVIENIQRFLIGKTLKNVIDLDQGY